MGIQARLTGVGGGDGGRCSLTQEMGAVWAAGDLFQAIPWVTAGYPSLEGRELKGRNKLGLGVSLLDPCLSTHSSPLCTEEPAEN